MKGKRRFLLARIATFALMLSFVAACSDDDSTGPAPDLDPTETQVALEQVVDQFFTNNQGLTSLDEFGIAIGEALPSVAPVTLSLTPESSTLHGMIARLRQSMSAVYARHTSHPMLMAAIPTELHGTTFEFNPTSGQYEPSDRPGAPIDGVTFILYDGITTLNEVGWFDIIDKSNFAVTPASIDISLEVFITDVSTTVPVVKYRITGTVSDTGGTLIVTGHLSDGSDQLDFDFQVTGSDATGFTADFTLSVENVLTVTLSLTESQNGSETIEAAIGDGTNEILFVLAIATNGDLQGGSGIFFNDVLVATFSGNVDQDTVTLNNTQGDPLTQQELLALAEIFVALEQSFVVMQNLFAFALGLIGVLFFF